MCFPSQAWELRAELAGQGDPVRLPGSAKTGNRALICGHMELGTRLRSRAAPPPEESHLCLLLSVHFHSCSNSRISFTGY